jgi:hypothetical protein
MDPIIAEIDELCKTPLYYRWGDKLVRRRQAFWHFISMDGLEIAATALSSQLFFNCTLCPTGANWRSSHCSHKEVSLVYFSTFEPIKLN